MAKNSSKTRYQLSLLMWFFVILDLFISALIIRYLGIIRGGAWAIFLFVATSIVGGIISFLVIKHNFRLPLLASIPAILVLAILSIAVIGYLVITINQAVKTVDTSDSLSLSIDDFQFTAFDDSRYVLSDYHGSIVLLHIWASWSEICKDQGQILQEIWNDYHDKGVEVFGVTFVDIDTSAQSALADWGISYPNGPDLGNRISTILKVTGVPETFIFAQDGALVETIRNSTTYQELATIIERLLEK